MTHPPETSQTLDWSLLAPVRERHYCNCDYCVMTGELEEGRVLSLVRMHVNGREYITDRFLALLSEWAPAIEDCTLPEPITRSPGGFTGAPVTDRPASGYFRDETLRALTACDWRLRKLGEHDGIKRTESFAVAVVTTGGQHIGWAIGRPAGDEKNRYVEPGGDA